MNKTLTLLSILILIGCAAPVQAQPNVLLFLVDDMGWKD